MPNSLGGGGVDGNFHGALFWCLTICFFEKHNKDVAGSFYVMAFEQEVFFFFFKKPTFSSGIV